MSEYFTSFHEKVSRYKTPAVVESVCCWTDLLGFGAALYGADWKPSEDLWSSMFNRIAAAHSDCYRSLELSYEFALTLNDGIVRCCNLADIDHVDRLSMWLRGCILTHNRINQRERDSGLPGARTILAHGEKLVHGPTELIVEDFVLNYTKQDPGGRSRLPREISKRIVASNPEPLQLNLAFSKAYILDRLGSSKGIRGAHFYIDESVLHAIARFAGERPPVREVIDREEEAGRLFAIPRQDDKDLHLGFRLQVPAVSVAVPEIMTRVHRAVGFYPWDEPLPFVLPIE